MSKKHSIYWTVEASNTYINTITFIFEKWTIKEVEHFEKLTSELLEKLKTNQKLCPEIKRLKLRKCVISQQTSLVYRVKSESIELINFVDNRSDHKY